MSLSMPHAKHLAETHAGVGLFFHDAAFLCLAHHSIDAGFGANVTSRQYP